jgi:hypothetical protein
LVTCTGCDRELRMRRTYWSMRRVDSNRSRAIDNGAHSSLPLSGPRCATGLSLSFPRAWDRESELHGIACHTHEEMLSFVSESQLEGIPGEIATHEEIRSRLTRWRFLPSPSVSCPRQAFLAFAASVEVCPQKQSRGVRRDACGSLRYILRRVVLRSRDARTLGEVGRCPLIYKATQGE